MRHGPVPDGDDFRLVDINHRFTFWAQICLTEGGTGECGRMESNQRYYMRRAAEERTATHRAVTEQAREWHRKLAQDFALRAQESHGIPLAATA